MRMFAATPKWPGGVRRSRILLFCALLCATAPLDAQESAFVFDPAQTQVEFSLGAVLHTVHGKFALKRGHVSFDVASGRATGELVVDATSAESGETSRDRRMHKDVLESDKFPEIVFHPTRVDGTIAPQGSSTVQLHGVFAIHGSEHEATVPVNVLAEGGRYTGTATLSVPYVKWGMKNPSTLLLRVNDHVELTIHATLTPKSGAD